MKQVDFPESILILLKGRIIVHIMDQMYVDIDTCRYHQYKYGMRACT